MDEGVNMTKADKGVTRTVEGLIERNAQNVNWMIDDKNKELVSFWAVNEEKSEELTHYMEVYGFEEEHQVDIGSGTHYTFLRHDEDEAIQTNP